MVCWDSRWGLAVTLGVYAGKYSGAHINPAVTIGLLSSGEIELFTALEYIIGQCLGAFTACVLVYIHYLPHWSKTDDEKVKLEFLQPLHQCHQNGQI